MTCLTLATLHFKHKGNKMDYLEEKQMERIKQMEEALKNARQLTDNEVAAAILA